MRKANEAKVAGRLLMAAAFISGGLPAFTALAVCDPNAIATVGGIPFSLDPDCHGGFGYCPPAKCGCSGDGQNCYCCGSHQLTRIRCDGTPVDVICGYEGSINWDAVCGDCGPNPWEDTEVCDGIDNDFNGLTDESGACLDEPRPPRCEDKRLFDDPVDIASGAVFLTREDFSVEGKSKFSFERMYSSNGDVFKLGQKPPTRPLWGVPKPFGADPNNPELATWWHNLFSFVGDYRQSYVIAYDLVGRMKLFHACQGTGCVLSNVGGGSQSQTEMLSLNTPDGGVGYTMVLDDGRRLEYGANWRAPERSRSFLTRIANVRDETIASITYHSNLTVDGEVCPACTDGCDAGTFDAPYIETVTVASGEAFQFEYRRISGQCVIDRISHTGETVVQFEYGDPPIAGSLAGVSYSAADAGEGRHEHYSSYDGGFAVEGSGGTRSYALEPGGRVTSVVGPRGETTTVDWVTRTLNRGAVEDPFGGTSPAMTTAYEVGSAYGQMGPRVSAMTDACASAAACVEGTTNLVWSSDWSGNQQSVPGAEGGSRWNSESYPEVDVYRVNDQNQRLELAEVRKGSPDGGVGLETCPARQLMRT